jgi:hypothetical protein
MTERCERRFVGFSDRLPDEIPREGDEEGAGSDVGCEISGVSRGARIGHDEMEIASRPSPSCESLYPFLLACVYARVRIAELLRPSS